MPTEDDNSITEQLTAYLDGELSGDELAEVERRLVQDSNFFARMRELQQGWDLLDALPPTQAYDAFVQTTMELAVQESLQAQPPASKWRQIIVALVGFVVIPALIFFVSFKLKSDQQAAPRRELLKNLPLIEGFEQYRTVWFDIDFLEQLQDSEFTSENLIPALNELPPVDSQNNHEGSSAVTTIAASEQRLKAMTPEQRDTIRRKKEEFEQLDPTTQSKIRSFHQSLMAAPRRSQLSRTLAKYYDWLKSLDDTDRNNLLDLSNNNKRIERILQLVNVKKSEPIDPIDPIGSKAASSLPVADIEKFSQWYADFVQRNQNKIAESAEAAFRADYLDREGQQAPPEEIKQLQRSTRKQLATLLEKAPEVLQELATQDELNLLFEVLTPEALATLSQSSDEKILVLRWIAAANQSVLPVSMQRLRDFVDSLPQAKQDEIFNLSQQTWRKTVEKMYRDAQRDNPTEED